MKIIRILAALCLAFLALPAMAVDGPKVYRTPTGESVSTVTIGCVNASGLWVPVDSTGTNCPSGSPATSGTYIGNVGGFDNAVSNTPTVQNAAYSSGNAIGGLQTIAFFRQASQPSGILNNISVVSRGGSTTALTFYIFNANPSATTCTDKSAFSLGTADISKLIATTPPLMTPAVVGAGTTATMASQQLPVAVKNQESTVNLYVCVVVGGSVTPASTTDLIFKFAGMQD